MDLGSVAGLLLGVFALVFGMTANLTNFANLGFFLDPSFLCWWLWLAQLLLLSLPFQCLK